MPVPRSRRRRLVRVFVVERFQGGGATAIAAVSIRRRRHGQQMEAGWRTPRGDVRLPGTQGRGRGGAATLRTFCAASAGLVAWLPGHGVPFEGSLCPDKTSYPTNRYYLYYSGSERSFGHVRGPAPRGHRAIGAALRPRAVRPARGGGARSAGVAGARRRRAADQPGHRPGRPGDRGGVPEPARRALAGPGSPTGCCTDDRQEAIPVRGQARAGGLHRPVGWLERRYARPLRVGAATRRGASPRAVSSRTGRCCGSMPRPTAAACRWARPATTAAASGSGVAAGGRDGSSWTGSPVWRFLTPAARLAARACWWTARASGSATSRCYGARDRRRHDAAGRTAGPGCSSDRADRVPRPGASFAGRTLWFQLLQAGLPADQRRGCAGPPWPAAAARAGVDADGLAATVGAHNAAAARRPSRTRRASPPRLVRVLCPCCCSP